MVSLSQLLLGQQQQKTEQPPSSLSSSFSLRREGSRELPAFTPRDVLLAAETGARSICGSSSSSAALPATPLWAGVRTRRGALATAADVASGAAAAAAASAAAASAAAGPSNGARLDGGEEGKRGRFMLFWGRRKSQRE